MKGKIARMIVKVILQITFVALTILLVWAYQSRKMEPLQIWHTVILENEFTARGGTAQSTLQDYLDLEERLFDELQEKVY